VKICFLTPSLGLHGGTLVMFRHAGHLAARGHDVTIVSPEEPLQCPVPDSLRFAFHKPRPGRIVFRSCKLVYLFSVARCLRSDFDVVIPTHTPLIVHAIFARWRYRLNYRAILLYQDFFAMPWVGRYIRFILSRKSLIKKLDGVIAVSEGSAREFQSASGRLPLVVMNGIDDLFFADGRSPKGRYVLFVGRPGKSKGFDVFARAMELVAKLCPGLKGVMISTEVEDGAMGAIQTVRFRDKEQLKKLYAEALVYVHAAVGESFGLPPVEAMAAGTAVVLTNTVGTRDYARHDQNCLSVEYGDFKTMAGHIVRLVQDENLRSRLEAEGRSTAAAFRWQNSLDAFEAAIAPGARVQKSETTGREHFSPEKAIHTGDEMGIRS
jgi:glycosyltransferase involved in cell wall biosynthesis